FFINPFQLTCGGRTDDPPILQCLPMPESLAESTTSLAANLTFTGSGSSGRVGSYMNNGVPATCTSGCLDAFRRWSFYAAALAIGFGALTAARAADVDFETDIAPILIKRCSECHGPDVQKSK